MFGLVASSLQNVALDSEGDRMFTLTGKHEMGFHQTKGSLALSTRVNSFLISLFNVGIQQIQSQDQPC